MNNEVRWAIRKRDRLLHIHNIRQYIILGNLTEGNIILQRT